MCWLDEVQGRTGWLATASRTGSVALWQVKTKTTTSLELDITLVGKFDSESKSPNTLHWTVLSDKKNSKY